MSTNCSKELQFVEVDYGSSGPLEKLRSQMIYMRKTHTKGGNIVLVENLCRYALNFDSSWNLFPTVSEVETEFPRRLAVAACFEKDITPFTPLQQFEGKNLIEMLQQCFDVLDVYDDSIAAWDRKCFTVVKSCLSPFSCESISTVTNYIIVWPHVLSTPENVWKLFRKYIGFSIVEPISGRTWFSILTIGTMRIPLLLHYDSDLQNIYNPYVYFDGTMYWRTVPLRMFLYDYTLSTLDDSRNLHYCFPYHFYHYDLTVSNNIFEQVIDSQFEILENSFEQLCIGRRPNISRPTLLSPPVPTLELTIRNSEKIDFAWFMKYVDFWFTFKNDSNSKKVCVDVLDYLNLVRSASQYDKTSTLTQPLLIESRYPEKKYRLAVRLQLKFDSKNGWINPYYQHFQCDGKKYHIFDILQDCVQKRYCIEEASAAMFTVCTSNSNHLAVYYIVWPDIIDFFDENDQKQIIQQIELVSGSSSFYGQEWNSILSIGIQEKPLLFQIDNLTNSQVIPFGCFDSKKWVKTQEIFWFILGHTLNFQTNPKDCCFVLSHRTQKFVELKKVQVHDSTIDEFFESCNSCSERISLNSPSSSCSSDISRLSSTESCSSMFSMDSISPSSRNIESISSSTSFSSVNKSCNTNIVSLSSCSSNGSYQNIKDCKISQNCGLSLNTNMRSSSSSSDILSLRTVNNSLKSSSNHVSNSSTSEQKVLMHPKQNRRRDRIKSIERFKSMCGNPVCIFLEQKCIVRTGTEIRAEVLYEAYCRWAINSGYDRRISSVKFGSLLNSFLSDYTLFVSSTSQSPKVLHKHWSLIKYRRSNGTIYQNVELL